MDGLIPKNPVLPALLGLRGVAAVAVLLFHLHHLAKLPLPPGMAFIGTHFGLGVQLFFVMSAFSLCYSTGHSVGHDNWIRNYCAKRFFRIAPLFYFMLLVWILVFRLRGASVDLGTVLLNVSLTFGLVPGKHASMVAAGWTIGVEMLFYCLLPLLLATVRGVTGSMVFLAFAAVVSGVSRVTLVQAGGPLASYAPLSFVVSLVVFAVGFAAFHVWKRLPAGRRVSVANAAFVIMLFAILASPVGVRLVTPARLDVMLWGICFGGLVVWQASAPSRFLSSAPLQFLGERSYGIYLLHTLVIVLMDKPIRGVHATTLPILGDWAFLVAGGFVSLAVVAGAAITYVLVEQPGIRLGQWLVKRDAEPPTGPGGSTTVPR